MMMAFLTKKQKGIYDYLKEYIGDKGYAPSIQEICEYFGTTSLSTMHKQLVTLENKGFIKRTPNMKRAIELIKEESNEIDPLEIPVMGIVSENNPIETTKMIEYMRLPDRITHGRRVYMLEVKGKAYEGEKISSGDYVIIESTARFKSDQIALIRLDKNNTTLRRIWKDKGKIKLALKNPDIKTMVFDESEIKILGVVVGVFRCFVD